MRQALPARDQASPRVAAVRYDRGDTTVGIVHVGVGAFHRSHLAEYVDDVLAAGDREWAICGVGLLAEDRPVLDALRAQDGLYTRTVKNADGSWSPRTIGSITEVLAAPDDPPAVVERMADPRVRIVSLTITEGGYLIDESTGEFDLLADALQADLDPQQAHPRTVFGFLVAALAARRSAGTAPFTVLSCDNLPANGEAIRRGVVAVARHHDPALASWIEQHVTFPSSMVDRITPAATDVDRARLEDEFGVMDAVPVVCEPFRQWVVEDTFASGRPAFEKHGAQLVEDVAPFEVAKLRLLNGGHQAIAHLGRLLGHDHVHEACCDPIGLTFLLAYFAEVQQTIEPSPQLDLDRYTRQLVARFVNPEMRDPLARISAFASDRIPKWVVPPLRDNLRHGRSAALGTLVIAAWHRSLEAAGAPAAPIAVPDRRSDGLRALAATPHDPVRFVRDRELFGDLADDVVFAASYDELVRGIRVDGVAHQVLRLLDRDLFGVSPPRAL